MRIVTLLMLIVVGGEILAASMSNSLAKHDHRAATQTTAQMSAPSETPSASECHHHNPILCESSMHCHVGYLPQLSFNQIQASSVLAFFTRPFDHALPNAPLISSLKRPPIA